MNEVKFLMEKDWKCAIMLVRNVILLIGVFMYEM